MNLNIKHSYLLAVVLAAKEALTMVLDSAAAALVEVTPEPEKETRAARNRRRLSSAEFDEVTRQWLDGRGAVKAAEGGSVTFDVILGRDLVERELARAKPSSGGVVIAFECDRADLVRELDRKLEPGQRPNANGVPVERTPDPHSAPKQAPAPRSEWVPQPARLVVLLSDMDHADRVTGERYRAPIALVGRGKVTRIQHELEGDEAVMAEQAIRLIEQDPSPTILPVLFSERVVWADTGKHV